MLVLGWLLATITEEFYRGLNFFYFWMLSLLLWPITLPIHSWRMDPALPLQASPWAAVRWGGGPALAFVSSPRRCRKTGVVVLGNRLCTGASTPILPCSRREEAVEACRTASWV